MSDPLNVILEWKVFILNLLKNCKNWNFPIGFKEECRWSFFSSVLDLYLGLERLSCLSEFGFNEILLVGSEKVVREQGVAVWDRGW